MRRVWGRKNSLNVMKVLWLLDELGLPYERVDAGGSFGLTDTPEYLEMNPNKVVPTLQEDGFTLWESNSILRYLCEANPTKSKTLWPPEPRARALIDRWLDWEQTTLLRPVNQVFVNLIRTPEDKRDSDAVARGRQESARLWSIIERQLNGNQYIAGPEFTLADIPLGVVVHRWMALPIERPASPLVAAWYQRLLSRSAYTSHVALPLS